MNLTYNDLDGRYKVSRQVYMSSLLSRHIMKKIIIFVAALFFLVPEIWSQIIGSNHVFNFDLEKISEGRPLSWESFGSDKYLVSLDSLQPHGGKYAVAIEYRGTEPNFRAWSLTIPGSYEGNSITLSGWVRTEGVDGGWAGLWMRIDPNVAFDNMEQRGITGSTGWTRYEITLDMDPVRTKQIVIGGLLAGTGKASFDDFTLSIDGRDIRELQPIPAKVFAAEKDTTFNHGSGIGDITPTPAVVENLRILGLTWGFLKYYHPAVAAGNYNWDYELFRILPKVIAATAKWELDDALERWVKNLGDLSPVSSRVNEKRTGEGDSGHPVEQAGSLDSTGLRPPDHVQAPDFAEKDKSMKKKDRHSSGRRSGAHVQPELPDLTGSIKMHPDLGWIEGKDISNDLVYLLKQVRDAKRTGEHYYVSLAEMVGNPIFTNEKSYRSMTYPDEGFRLLALFRYWNMIQYFFPYKYLIDEDWKGVLAEFIPKFLGADNELEYQLAVVELIARVHDTHANLWSRADALSGWKGVRYAPVELVFAEQKAVVKGFYLDDGDRITGLLAGDVITHINGKKVEEIMEGRLKYYPASNPAIQLRDITRDLLRSNDSAIAVDYDRGGNMVKASLRTYGSSRLNFRKKNERQDTCFRFIDPKIAYIFPGRIKNSYLPSIKESVAKTKGLIIDLRCYPSEFIVFTLGSFLVPDSTAFARFSSGSIENPGLFTFSPAIKLGAKNKDYYKGKVVILVDETTVSQAEYTTMAFRTAPRATVIGSTTAGADGNVSAIVLPGNLQTMISGIGVYYPGGGETQRIGIVPDIVVEPTVGGIREGRDEVLEKAVELIRK